MFPLKKIVLIESGHSQAVFPMNWNPFTSLTGLVSMTSYWLFFSMTSWNSWAESRQMLDNLSPNTGAPSYKNEHTQTHSLSPWTLCAFSLFLQCSSGHCTGSTRELWADQKWETSQILLPIQRRTTNTMATTYYV